MIEKIAIIAFVLLSAPLIAGLMTTIVAALFFMIFTDVPPEDARALGPYFLVLAAVVYGSLCWSVVKRDD